MNCHWTELLVWTVIEILWYIFVDLCLHVSGNLFVYYCLFVRLKLMLLQLLVISVGYRNISTHLVNKLKGQVSIQSDKGRPVPKVCTLLISLIHHPIQNCNHFIVMDSIMSIWTVGQLFSWGNYCFPANWAVGHLSAVKSSSIYFCYQLLQSHQATLYIAWGCHCSIVPLFASRHMLCCSIVCISTTLSSKQAHCHWASQLFQHLLQLSDTCNHWVALSYNCLHSIQVLSTSASIHHSEKISICLQWLHKINCKRIRPYPRGCLPNQITLW